MQFRISTRADLIDVHAVEEALRATDPAAMVDLAGAGGQLRVSTCLSLFELVELVDGAGFPITHDQVMPLRSECCGGCGG